MSYFKTPTFISYAVVCSELPKLSKLYQAGHSLSMPGLTLVKASQVSRSYFYTLLPQQVAAHFLWCKDKLPGSQHLCQSIKGRRVLQSSEVLAHCRTDLKRHPRVPSRGFPLPLPGGSVLLGHTSGYTAPFCILHSATLKTERL